MSDLVVDLRAHDFQIEALSHFVGITPNVPLAIQQLAGGFNFMLNDARTKSWPSPPGVPSLTSEQKVGLFKLETGLATEGEWIDLMPGIDTATLTVYKQFYGPSSPGWTECQYWYGHR